MARLEIAPANDRVETVRKILDPFTSFPPTVGTNKMLPGLTILIYDGVADETGFIFAALSEKLSVSRL